MIHNTAEPKALQLSKEETLALLDMCMNSAMELQDIHEQALTKLGDLARSYIVEDMNTDAAYSPNIASESSYDAYAMPVRATFWTRGSIRSRLRSLPPLPETEVCR